MNWYKGYEIENLYDGAVTPTTERKRMGAALHSQPVLINYGYTGDLSTAANANNQDNYLFFSTLEGTLHAIEAKTGIEKFSFIPSEKLATLKSQYDNAPSALPQFGMDLTWTVLRKDSDNSGKIGAGDKIYLYGGMRMGGSNYYAIDATNLTAPKLLFAIDGGVGGADKYTNMGQTWSQPVIANVKVNGVNTAVIIFGGGYDPRHETANEIFTGNDKGNQLYIVDAITGDLLWFASGNSADNADKYVEDMKFSVPSSPKPVDVNGDGITDAIYFGDLGGQVFRVDLDNKASSGTSIAKRVRLLAKLGQTESATPANQRRFYEPPAVATFKDSAGNKFATVAIGSGYRSRPFKRSHR
jgi:type IV pilus assembly protein PilY1